MAEVNAENFEGLETLGIEITSEFRKATNNNRESVAAIVKDLSTYFQYQKQETESVEAAVEGLAGEVEGSARKIEDTNELLRNSINIQNQMLGQLGMINSRIFSAMANDKTQGAGGSTLADAGAEAGMILEKLKPVASALLLFTSRFGSVISTLLMLKEGFDEFSERLGKDIALPSQGFKYHWDWKKFGYVPDEDQNNKDNATPDQKPDAGAIAPIVAPKSIDLPSEGETHAPGSMESLLNKNNPSAVGGGPGYNVGTGGTQYNGDFRNAKTDPNTIYNYLKSKGLSDNQIKGIMGNVARETGGTFAANTYNPNDEGSPSGGIFQHHGPRFTNLEKQVPDWRQNVTGQLDFALSEPDMKKYLSQDYKSPEEAAAAFYRDFERGKNVQSDLQKANARIAQLDRAGVGGNKPTQNDTTKPNMNALTGVSLEGVNTALVSNLGKAAAEYLERTGQKVIVNSGKRSSEKQAKLYDDWIHGRSPYPAAKPGTSMHERGLAVDIDVNQAAAMDQMGILAKYGLNRPVKGDPVHIQLTGSPSEDNYASSRQSPEKRDAAASIDKAPSSPALPQAASSEPMTGSNFTAYGSPLASSSSETKESTFSPTAYGANLTAPAPPPVPVATPPSVTSQAATGVTAPSTNQVIQKPVNTDGKKANDDNASPAPDFIQELNKWLDVRFLN